MRVKLRVAGVAAVAMMVGLPLFGAGSAFASAPSRDAAGSTNTAIQAARTAARASQSLAGARAAARTAARNAAAAHVRAEATRKVSDIVSAYDATRAAARLSAKAAQAQLAYNRLAGKATAAAKTTSKSWLDVGGGGGQYGTLSHSTDETAQAAADNATSLCAAAAQDVAERDAAQARLTKAQANPRTTPEEIASLTAKLATKTSDATASAAACTDAQKNAATEAASTNGINDGTSVEGTSSLADPQPFPDNLASCPTTTGPTTPCHSDNLELVGSTRGNQTGGSPSCPAFNPTKCPGFSALNFVTGYEGLGYDFMIANGTSGLSVWSLKDPAHPQFISSIPFADLAGAVGAGVVGTQFWEGENETVDSARKLVFMSRDVGNKGLFIIDLKDPWHPSLVGFQKVPQGHTATCLNGCRFLWSVGGVQSGGAGYTGKSSPVSTTDMRDPAHPFTYTTAVAANVTRLGSAGGSTHSVDVDFNGVAWVSASSGVRGYWTSGKHYNPVTNSDGWATPYAPLPYAGGRITGNTSSFMHNAYHFPNALNGGPAGDVMLVTNESNNTNCASAGVFILSSLAGTYDDHGLVITPPNTVAQMNRFATFTVNGKPGQFHGTVPGVNNQGQPITVQLGDCSSHWFTVRGNLVAAAFYEQGLRLIDVSNPAAPAQVGYGRVPVRAATADAPAIVSSDSAGAYWHGKYIYVADYQRGVDVWKYSGDIPGIVEHKTCWNSCEK